MSANFHLWLPTTVPVDVGDVAKRAVAQLRLSAIRIAMHPVPTSVNPKLMGIVGQQMWMWADEPDASTWGPHEVSVSVDGHSVGLKAQVEKVVWDMGNQKSVTCSVPGTRWERWRVNSAYPDPKSPDCGYVYERQGQYTITATSHWKVQWAALGQTGVIRFTLSSKVDMLVGEIQVLNVPNPKR